MFHFLVNEGGGRQLIFISCLQMLPNLILYLNRFKAHLCAYLESDKEAECNYMSETKSGGPVQNLRGILNPI